MTAGRAARVAGSLLLFLICISCGETYRPVANPVIPNQPNPAFAHVAIVLSGNGSNNAGASTTIDVSGDTAVSQATVGLMPAHATLALNATRVYVANAADDTVSEFSPSNPTPVTTVSLPAGSAPAFVTTAETASTYVANPGAGTISVISNNGTVLTDTVPVGVQPVAMAETPNGQKLYVANQGNNGSGGSVTSINTVDKSVNSSAPLTGFAWVSPVWVVARPDSQRVYVLDRGSGQVAAIDTSLDAVVSTVSVGAGANFMIYDSKRNRIYVVDPAAGTLTSLEAATDALTALTVSVANPVSVAALPDGSRVYVSTAAVSGGTVTSGVVVLNAVGLTAKTTIPLTSVPAACATQTWSRLSIAAAADSSKVYVGNCDAGNTAIIQPSSDTLLLQVPAPISAAQPSQLRITAATQSGANTAYAYTLVSGPPLTVGVRVAITGMGDSGNNGTFSVIAANAGTFTVANASGVTASGQNGTGTAVTLQNPVFVLTGP
ncbi:MAG: YncE family protein [Acidobacteriia bacterium]|nr:YncE family protein [Terriglobia bacterium]